MPDSATSPAGTYRFTLRSGGVEIDLLVAQFWAAGALGVWEKPDGIVAWFASRPSLPADLEMAGQWSIEPDRDWQREWKATIRPVRAGRTVIVPTWLADDHLTEPGDRTIVLDPGRAFGSGHHATTTLCLEALDDLDDELGLAGSTVADIGCGSGVLAIAAALLGAEAMAVDIDPAAVEVTRENAARNDAVVDVKLGSVDALPGPADIVVANLVTDVVTSLAGALVGACRDTLVVSGIATAREGLARRALEDAGATVADVRERDGWLALRARVGDDPAAHPDPRAHE